MSGASFMALIAASRAGKAIDGYAIRWYNGAGVTMTHALYGSNTGAFAGEETTSNSPGSLVWIADENKTFTVSSPLPFRYYRFKFTASSSGAGQIVISVIALNISSVNQLNTFSSYTSGAQTVSADTDIPGSSQDTWRAVDGSAVTVWASANAAPPHYWQVDFGP